MTDNKISNKKSTIYCKPAFPHGMQTPIRHNGTRNHDAGYPDIWTDEPEHISGRERPYLRSRASIWTLTPPPANENKSITASTESIRVS